MAARTTSPRTQLTKESSSPLPSCPPLVRCAMVGGALSLLGTAGWLIYLGWAVAVSAIGPFAFLIWIEYVVVGLFWILGIALIIEAIALIHTYTRRSGQRYHEEGFGLGVTLLYPLLAGVEIGYNTLIHNQSHHGIRQSSSGTDGYYHDHTRRNIPVVSVGTIGIDETSE